MREIYRKRVETLLESLPYIRMFAGKTDGHQVRRGRDELRRSERRVRHRHRHAPLRGHQADHRPRRRATRSART